MPGVPFSGTGVCGVCGFDSVAAVPTGVCPYAANGAAAAHAMITPIQADLMNALRNHPVAAASRVVTFVIFALASTLIAAAPLEGFTPAPNHEQSRLVTLDANVRLY